YILGILTDLEGNICFVKRLKFKDLSFEGLNDKIFTIIDLLIASAPPSPYGIIGVGVGVRGTVNKEGELLLAPNLGWKNVQLKIILQEKYNLPDTIKN